MEWGYRTLHGSNMQFALFNTAVPPDGSWGVFARKIPPLESLSSASLTAGNRCYRERGVGLGGAGRGCG
ncbi:MAG: hypothetical protein LBQ54_04110 [Planctomycetaceae bacterium]|jgi:hypothetical protein|nr:hypothetical protein [Planctomycetaceae bacterium]